MSANETQLNQVRTRLAARRAELEHMGIVHLSVFGSVARGTDSRGSDIDLLAEIDHAKISGLLRFAGIRRQISEMLGRDDVDLFTKSSLQDRVAASALRDLKVIF